MIKRNIIYNSNNNNNNNNNNNGWWFERLWKILVSCDDYSQYMEK